jgi:hypothetical protein
MHPAYTCLGGNHLIQVFRAFHAGVKTTSEAIKKHKVVDEKGCLSLPLLKAAYPVFGEAAEKGIPMRVLRESIRQIPDALNTTQNALNVDLTRQGTEVQLLAEAVKLVHLSETRVIPKREILATLSRDWSHLKDYLEGVVQFADTYSAGPFIEDLLQHATVYVNGSLTRVSSKFWQDLAELPAGCAMAAMSLMKAQWSAQPHEKEGKLCKVITSARALKAETKVPNIHKLEETCRGFRVQHRDALAGLELLDKVKTLATLDVWAGRLFASSQGTTEVESWLPEDLNRGAKLQLTSLDQVKLAAWAYMESLRSFQKCKSPTHPDPKVSSIQRTKDRAGSASSGRMGDYTREGHFVGHMRVLGQAGLKVGTEFVFTKGYFHPVDKVTVPPTFPCTITKMLPDSLEIRPRRHSPFMMAAEAFPVKEIRVTQSGKGVLPTCWAFQEGSAGGKCTAWLKKAEEKAGCTHG